MIHLLRKPATPEQVQQMLETLGGYIKLAVDIRRGILAGGGGLHADCEAVLLSDGSKQEDVWGADWIPGDQTVRFSSLINIRPQQKNTSLEIQDPNIRKEVEKVARGLLEIG